MVKEQTHELPIVPSPYLGKLTALQHFVISAYWFATNFLWGSLLLIMLPGQIKTMNPGYRTEALGLLTGAAAIVALILPLYVGALSDRCASKWGRRRPFMAVGIVVNLIGLIGMAWAFGNTTPSADGQGVLGSILGNSGILLFFLMYLVVQIGNNITSSAYMGVIPDLVPANQRGTASGYMALMSQAGTLFGAVMSGMLFGNKGENIKYALLCVVLAGIGAITVIGMKENPLPYKPMKIHWPSYIRSLWIDPKKHSDFAWVWITRALVMLGFYAVLPFVNYYLVDVINIPADKVEATAPLLLGVILIASSISGVVGGQISDRVGRKKVVYVANAAIAFMALGFIFCHSMTDVLIVGALFGVGYGAYVSVDYALGTDVLPNKQDAAKEMAVWHIAMTLPQSIAAPAAGFLIAAFGKTVEPASLPGGEAIVHYTHAGYSAVFILCAVCFAVGAILLKNVRGAH